MSKNLDEQVRAGLCDRRGDWLQIAQAAEVSHSWFSKFVNRRIPNPGYATLQKLHTHLTAGSKPASVAGRSPASNSMTAG